MSWFKLDDGWLTNPKIRRAGRDGRALWIAGGLHCAQQLTDGMIDKEFVPLLAALAEVSPKTARILVESGLWIDRGDCFEMHEYLDYQPSKEKVLADREAAKKRQRRHRGQPIDDEVFGENYGGSNAVSHGVTDGVSNGVSHTTPSRPVPSRPSVTTSQHSSSVSETPPEHAAAAATVDESPAIAQVLDLAVQVRLKQAGASVKNPGPWGKSVRRNMSAEHGALIAAEIAASNGNEPDITGIVAKVLGCARTEVAAVKLGGGYL